MIILALCLGIILSINAFAYATPLAQFPTGNAAWTVDISYLHSAHGPQVSTRKQARKVEVTQVDNVRRTRITWTDGKTTEQWSIPNVPMIFKEYPDGSVFPVHAGEREAKDDGLKAPSDLSAFDWLTSAFLQEKDPVSYQGAMCYHYVGGASNTVHTSKGKQEVSRGKQEAWIDSKTLAPVALDTETLHCVFKFLPPPNGPLAIPPKFQEEIEYYKHIKGLL